MLIEKGHVTMDNIACMYHKRLEASPELLYQACESFIEPTPYLHVADHPEEH